MKTKNLLSICFAMLTLNSIAESPTWQWAKNSGGNFVEFGKSIATDGSGNVVVTGNFISSSITFGITTLTNAGSFGSTNLFIVKYDAAGNVLWAKSAGGNVDDESSSVTTDGSGNILLTGYFSSPTITFGTTTLTNTGSLDMFIIKYDATGNELWAKSVGGSSADYASSVATDGSENVLVTGSFKSSSITFGTTTLTNVGIEDMFIVKYDAAGNELWAKSTGGSSSDIGSSVATDVSGNVLVTGSFKSSTITFGTTSLTNAGSTNLFIVKYDAAGNELWAKSAGGTSDDNVYSIATDGSGNVLATGYFASPNITFGTTTLINEGVYDMFIVKYDTSGNVLWAKRAGGDLADYANSVATDASGNVLITGYYDGTIIFGTTTLANAGNGDMFIVKYDASGNVLWAKSAGGGETEEGLSVATDGSENVLVTGFFGSPTITFGTTTLTNAGYWNMFIAKINTTTGIENIENKGEILLYPNPTNGLITLSLSQKLNNAGIKLISITGQMVMEKTNLAGDKFTFDISEQAKGFYFLEVKEAGSISRIKLVKN